jgi:hypothetical protein
MGTYIDESGEAVVKPSFCVLTDLLGFTRLVSGCKTEEESSVLCAKVQSILNQRRTELDPPGISGEWLRDWEFQMFSDSLVLGYPIREGISAGEPELGRVLSQITQYQLAMLLDGFVLRGGLAVGELHMSPDLVFGKALVEAHQLEKSAEFPRIVLSDAAVELVRHHMGFYGQPRYAPQNDDLILDLDGNVFIDYLQGVNSSEYGSDLSLLGRHKTLVVDRLAQFASDEHVLEKYRWVRDYHNYFCRTRVKGSEEWCPSWSQVQELLIETSDEPRRFRRLAELADQ